MRKERRKGEKEEGKAKQMKRKGETKEEGGMINACREIQTGKVGCRESRSEKKIKTEVKGEIQRDKRRERQTA